MRNSTRSSLAVGAICVFSLEAISVLAGCGKLRSWYDAHKQPTNSHSVTIGWTASASPVEGYNVYRATPSGAPARITVRLVLGTRYTDTTVEPGRSYSYYVTSVDFKGTESVPSELITVTVPATAAPGSQD